MGPNFPAKGQGLQMADWVFSRIAAASIRRDPNETELFKTEQVGDGEYAGTDALVREVIQNSLDAGNRSDPVRVRFALHEAAELPPRNRLSQYFRRLGPALASRDIELEADGVPALPNGFLVCEDFGTNGLDGDPTLIKDPPKDWPKREDFYWFWRNIGRSGKTGDDLGRWGLGKTVYRAASRVGCMFGLTIRARDSRRLLMGQAVLKIHQYQGSEYAPEGFWCARSQSSDTPLAIECPEEISHFAAEWRLARRHEPGLSVVVPYVAEELQAESLLRLAIVNFFIPILERKLVIEIAASSRPDDPWVVNHQTIESICRTIDWNGRSALKLTAPPPLAFANVCLQHKSRAVETAILGETKLPSVEENSFSSEQLDSLRKRYAQQDVVGIKVRLRLPQKTGDSPVGELLAFLQKTATPERHDSYYIREGMTITKLNTKRSVRGVRGLVMVDPGPLAALLGDTEGPAHNTWDTSNDERPNKVWKTWKGRVTFCSHILDSLLELLTPKSTKPDFDLLSEFFSIKRPSAPQPARTTKPGDVQEDPEPFRGPTATPHWYRLDGRPGGFRIADSGKPIAEVGKRLSVSVAYDLPTGNPLKGWCKYDFDFKSKENSLKFQGRCVEVKVKSGNTLELRVKESDFQLIVTGFDVNRDLFIRIDEIDAETEDLNYD
jgi:hypothetical protein